MTDLDRLLFSEIRDAHPDRYERADLAASMLVDEGDGMFVVRRDGSDEAHVCNLVESCGQHWGSCECDGYKYNGGPCSHLCALWRASHEGLVHIPSGRIVRASVEVVDPEEERAQMELGHDNRIATDGGIR